MKNTSQKLINLILLLATIILAIGIGLYFAQTNRYVSTNGWVIHTYNVLQKINDAELLLYQEEMQRLGIPISIDSRKTLAGTVDKLFKLTVDNPKQQNNLIELQKLLEQHRASNKTGSEFVKLLKLVSLKLDSLEDEEITLLSRRSADALHDVKLANSWGQLVLVAAILLIIAGIICVNYLFITRDRAEAVAKDYFESLAKSEIYKNAILNSINDMIMTINQQGKILSINSSLEKTFQFSAQQLLNQSIKQILPEFIYPKSLPVKIFESTGMTAANKLIPLEVAYSAMQVADEDLVVVTMRDISERKQIDNLKNDFISVISHELRTPLTSINGAVALLLAGEKIKSVQDQKKLLTIAKNNCDRLLNIVNDLLDMQKITSGNLYFNPEVFDINANILSTIKACQPLLHSDIKITSQFFSEKSLVNLDPNRFAQVVTNLLSNAIKFAAPATTITLSTALLPNKYIKIAVHNSGEVIPEEFRMQAFKKFNQANSTSRRSYGGTGLGLSICKALVDKFGGEINYSSSIEQGTIFYFTVPYFENLSHS